MDLFLPAAPKDYSKLPFVVESVRACLPEIETIHIVTPDDAPIVGPVPRGVVRHLDGQVLPFAKAEMPYRANWIYQMFLKLFQDVTAGEWYMVTDADIIFARPLPLWNSSRPILYLARDQYSWPFFKFNEAVLGFGKVYDWSFVSECLIYSKRLVHQMLDFMHLDAAGLWHKTCEIIGPDCYPGEPELYGSYVMHEHPMAYEVRHIGATLSGKYGGQAWSDEEIRAEITLKRESDPECALISLHSWEGM